jgi:hypothetical protein
LLERLLITARSPRSWVDVWTNISHGLKWPELCWIVSVLEIGPLQGSVRSDVVLLAEVQVSQVT